MKSLLDRINESMNRLTSGKTGIVVFDIDDTLLKADLNAIGIIKYVNGDKYNKVRLSTDEYAKDPDAKNHKSWYSYEEFNDPVKVMHSIINGTPILKNMHIMDAYINAGYEFCFLTARGCEDAVTYALSHMLMVRDADGNLNPIGDNFNKKISAAVNDVSKGYVGKNDAEKKANVLKDIASKYDYVVFVDDDRKNVAFARSLNIKNLTVIKAAK